MHDYKHCERVVKFMENIKPLSQRALATCKGNEVSLTFSQLHLNWIYKVFSNLSYLLNTRLVLQLQFVHLCAVFL